MKSEYRRLENPKNPRGRFYITGLGKSKYSPPRIGDIVSVTTMGKIYLQILIEEIDQNIIRGEVVGLGPDAAPIIGTINQDRWELANKIEIEQSWINGITYHDE